MSEWKKTTLGNLANVQTGPFGSQLHNSDYVKYGTPIVTVEHLGNRKMTRQNLPRVGVEDKIRLNRYTLISGDLVFSRVGSVDRCSFVGKDENGWLFSGRCLRVRVNAKIIDNNYLYYFFCLETTKETIRQIAVGATMPSINTEILSKVEVSYPPLPEQKAIAEVLSSLDDKIDLLNRQNKTLEALASTYFRQWFIEEAEEDWETTNLGSILSIIESGSRPKGGIDPNLNYGIPSIGAESINGLGVYDFSKTKYVSKEFYDKLNRGKVQSHDVLIYKDGAYVGKKGMFANGFPFKKYAVNEHVFILRANEKANQTFLYLLLNEDELSQLNSNSAQPGLNQEAMKSFQIKLPPLDLISNFETIVEPMITKIFNNAKQIQTLQKLRDTLLPKLISGEVRVAI